MKRIILTEHAAQRLFERALKQGLGEYEAFLRLKYTIHKGKKPKKHRSKRYKTKCCYFKDNLSFYVIYHERLFKICIKTIIIDRGRE